MSEEPIWLHTPPHIKAWVGELQAEIERLKADRAVDAALLGRLRSTIDHLEAELKYARGGK